MLDRVYDDKPLGFKKNLVATGLVEIKLLIKNGKKSIKQMPR